MINTLYVNTVNVKESRRDYLRVHCNTTTTLLYTAVLSSSFKFTCRFSYADKPTVCH